MIRQARAASTTAVLLCGLLGCGDAAFNFDLPPADGGGADAASAADGGPSACGSDANCSGLRCDVASGLCVACLQDADCTASDRARCEPTSHVCVACLIRPDCGIRRDCDTVTHRCLDACFDDDDPCPMAGFTCGEHLGRCIECRTNANCTGSAGGAVCDAPIGRCVACTSNAQCAGTQPVCDRRTGRCEACVSSEICGPGSACDPVSLTCRRVP